MNKSKIFRLRPLFTYHIFNYFNINYNWRNVLYPMIISIFNIYFHLSNLFNNHNTFIREARSNRIIMAEVNKEIFFYKLFFKEIFSHNYYKIQKCSRFRTT